VQGSASRRPTKAERREQARREREELQRRMSRRTRNRRIGFALVAVAVVGAGFAVAVAAGSGIASPGELLDQAPQAKRAAGCGRVREVPPYGAEAQDRAHIGGEAFPTPPPLSSYPATPPTSGPHNGSTLPAGFYDVPPPVDQTLHSLEHGAAIIWYAPSAADSQALEQIREFYGQRLSQENVSQDRVIIAPYDYPEQGEAGSLPQGAQMALAAWHELETCARADLASAFDFTARYAFPTAGGQTYRGVSPPAERGSAI
jgi:uncharacterized protein DUF3105